METIRVVLYAGALTAAAALAGCDAPTQVSQESLEGTWTATSARYSNNANEAQWIDVVGTYGASITLSVAATGATSFSFSDGRGNMSSDSRSQLNLMGANLVLAGMTFQVSRSGTRLTLTNSMDSYDFDGNGSREAATLVIMLTRG